MFNPIVSSTGFAHLLGFVASALLSYRFYQNWRQERNIVSKLFFYMVISITISLFASGIAGLFFAQNIQILKGAVIFSSFMQIFVFSSAAFTITYLKLPKVSPWLVTGVIFVLELIAVILTVIIPFYPFIDSSGGINWGNQPIADQFKLILSLIVFLPLLYILFEQMIISKDSSVRTKALGLFLITLFGVLMTFFDFLLVTILQSGALARDAVVSTFAIIIFVVIFFTQKSSVPGKPKEEKFTPPSLKVPW